MSLAALTKAFDKVPHWRLLEKLKAHGIGGQLINWIKAWLEGRKQRTCLGGVKSGWRIVVSGVPQGSVLGPRPLLFLIFINDIDTGILNTILKFADDIKLYGKAVSPADILQLQSDLNKLCKWAEEWQMRFNVSKCKVMHIGSNNAGASYYMNGQLLDQMLMHKDLGVIVTCNVKIAEQCSHAYIKANKSWDWSSELLSTGILL